MGAASAAVDAGPVDGAPIVTARPAMAHAVVVAEKIVPVPGRRRHVERTVLVVRYVLSAAVLHNVV
jgi:hypothetical protein